MKGWMTRKLRLEAYTRPPMLIALSVGALALLFFLLAFSTNFGARLSGLGTLDSADKARRFADGGYYGGRLPYAAAEVVGEAVLESRSQNNVGLVFGSSVYVETPLGDERVDTTVYRIWKLRGEGFTAICLDEREDLPAYGSIRVNGKASWLEDSQRAALIADFAPEAEHAVVLLGAKSGSSAPYLSIVMALCAIFAVIWMRSKSALRHTKLGRMIAVAGDFDAIRAEFDMPRFASEGFAVSENYLLDGATPAPFIGDLRAHGELFRRSDILSVEQVADEDGEVRLEIALRGRQEPLVHYCNPEKDAALFEELGLRSNVQI